MSQPINRAYDKDLATRIQSLMRAEPGLSQKKMFGGLAFLVNGNMAIAASGQGGLLVRVDPDQTDKLLATTAAVMMEMRGQKMRGWLRAGLDQALSDAELARWVELGTAYAQTLPPKSR